MSVEIAICSRDGKFSDDVMSRIAAAAEYAQRQGIVTTIARSNDRYNAATCRNRAVAGFLSRKKDFLLFVDDDVLIPAKAVQQLYQAARDNFNSLVCASVPSIRIGDMGETKPYLQVRPIGGIWLEQWFSGIVECEMCGISCQIFPRDVFADVGFPWFEWPETYTPEVGVKAMTDDTHFCGKARAKGYRILALGEVRCGHKKTIDAAILIPNAITEGA